MVSQRLFRKKATESEKLLSLIDEILGWITSRTNGPTCSSNFKRVKDQVKGTSKKSIINKNLELNRINQIKYYLNTINNYTDRVNLKPNEYRQVEKFIKNTKKYFNLNKIELGFKIPESISEPKTFEHAQNLKNWNNPPIIFFLTEEQEKIYKIGATVSSVGGSVEFSKKFHKLKFDKCKRCKGKNFSFIDENRDKIFCIKCGQRYQVIEPNSKKVWTFK